MFREIRLIRDYCILTSCKGTAMNNLGKESEVSELTKPIIEKFGNYLFEKDFAVLTMLYDSLGSSSYIASYKEKDMTKRKQILLRGAKEIFENPVALYGKNKWLDKIKASSTGYLGMVITLYNRAEYNVILQTELCERYLKLEPRNEGINKLLLSLRK